jgi:hypothetical protein
MTFLALKMDVTRIWAIFNLWTFETKLFDKDSNENNSRLFLKHASLLHVTLIYLPVRSHWFSVWILESQSLNVSALPLKHVVLPKYLSFIYRSRVVEFQFDYTKSQLPNAQLRTPQNFVRNHYHRFNVRISALARVGRFPQIAILLNSAILRIFLSQPQLPHVIYTHSIDIFLPPTSTSFPCNHSY